MQEYHFNLFTVDRSPITEKTGVAKLNVKAFKLPKVKQDIVFWYDKKDIPNPGEVINPGINMHVTAMEEIEPNTYAIKDYSNREFILKLLYVGGQ